MGATLNPLGLLSKTAKSALSVLDNPNDTGAPFGALQYPVDLDKIDYGHFIMFHVVETTKGSGTISSNFKKGFIQAAKNPYAGLLPGGNLAAGLIGGALGAAVHEGASQTGKQVEIVNRGRKRIEETQKAISGANASTSQTIIQNPLQTQTVNTIILYMPEKITAAYGFDYAGESLRIASAGLGIIESVADIFGGGTVVDDDTKAQFLAGISKELGRSFGAKLIDALGSAAGLTIGALGAIERRSRQVVNPHMQFLYKSVNQRTFEYTFNFAPRSAKESEALDNIVRAFKFYSHPEILSESGGRFHGYPAEFDIQYISKEKKKSGEPYFQENDWLNRVGRCYLKGVSVDYSGADTFSTFRHHEAPTPEKFLGTTTQNRLGNPPTFVTLTLSFSELETLNRKHIQEGF